MTAPEPESLLRQVYLTRVDEGGTVNEMDEWALKARARLDGVEAQLGGIEAQLPPALSLGIGLGAIAALIGLAALGFAYASTWSIGPDSARWATTSALTFIAAVPFAVASAALIQHARSKP